MSQPRKGYRPCEGPCGKNRAIRFFKPNGRVCFDCQRKTRKKATHELRVQKTYGLLPGEWDKLYEAQGGACAICGAKPRYKMDVDHSHATGLIRALTCRRCNRRLLPAAKDNPELLRKAAAYLEDSPALRILGERYFSG